MNTPLSLPALGYLVSRYPAVSHTFILREVARLRALGHVIHTASINPPDRALAHMEPAERAEAEATYCVKGDGVAGALTALAWWSVRSPLALLRTLLRAPSFGGWRGLAYAVEAAMVGRWLRRNGLPALHVHFGNAGAAVGVLVKTLTGCHLSYTIHGPDEFDDVPGQRLRLKMRAADAVVCISQFARSQLMRITPPGDWPKLQVCRLGVDPSRFAFVAPAVPAAGQPLRLLSVGRLTPAKGQLLLVRACQLLADQGVDFRLQLIGDGPDRDRVRQAVVAAGLEDRITLAGAQGQQAVRDAMTQSDVFVLPSLAEGIPVALMEAMASGVTCVSTVINGIPELIEHGRTGLLTAPGDVHGLTTQLARLAADPALRARLARDARRQVERQFDLDTNVRQLSALFTHFSLAAAR